MRKPAFLSNERLSRFLVSLLLTMGLLLPLMFTFEAESALALAIVAVWRSRCCAPCWERSAAAG